MTGVYGSLIMKRDRGRDRGRGDRARLYLGCHDGRYWLHEMVVLPELDLLDYQYIVLFEENNHMRVLVRYTPSSRKCPRSIVTVSVAAMMTFTNRIGVGLLVGCIEARIFRAPTAPDAPPSVETGL